MTSLVLAWFNIDKRGLKFTRLVSRENKNNKLFTISKLTYENIVIFRANSAPWNFLDLHLAFKLFFYIFILFILNIITRCYRGFTIFDSKSVEKHLQSLRRQCPFAVIDHYNFDSPGDRNFKQVADAIYSVDRSFHFRTLLFYGWILAIRDVKESKLISMKMKTGLISRPAAVESTFRSLSNESECN